MSVLAFVLGFVLVGLGVPHGVHDGGESAASIDATVTAVEHAEDARAMLETVNAERAARGLAALAFDERLCALARAHALDMVERSYFAHATPEGQSPFARMRHFNYRFNYAGENIALDESVDTASRALFASTEHRANILQPHFNRIGIAAVASTDGEIFVEDFSD